MDYQDGLDRIVLEKLGITRYANTGGPGTVYAYDDPSGDVILKAQDSAGHAFQIVVDDPNGTLSAANFSAADFTFA